MQPVRAALGLNAGEQCNRLHGSMLPQGNRLRKYASGSGSSSHGHDKIVNACTKLYPTSGSGSEANLVASASDDGTARVWDRREKKAVMVLGGGSNSRSSSRLPILAVAGTDQQLFTGGIDNRITAWDLNMRKKQYAMAGHTDTITSLALHPSVANQGDATFLLSNAMDSTLKQWDVQPFVHENDGKTRLVKTFDGGHKHNAEKSGLLKCNWNASGTMVTCGSADRLVHIYDEFSTDELYLLPGHKGCVHTVCFHPMVENVIASGSSDKSILVGELS